MAPARPVRLGAPAFVLIAALSVPCLAAADPSPTELKSARDLFAQAERDEDAGRWSDALDKFRLVARVKLTAGVRYHLALCEERTGDLVAALDEYSAAQAQAQIEHAEDVASLVGPALAEVTARVPRVIIHVAPDVPDVGLSVDDAPVDRSRVGQPLPVNPGTHRVDAVAPDRTPVRQSVTLRERETLVVDIHFAPPPPTPAPAVPEAGPAPVPAVTPAPPIRRSHPPSASVPALALGGGAVALAGFGVASFVLAGKARRDGASECAAVRSLSATTCDGLKERVRAWDWLALGSWTAAAAAAGTAVVLWTRSPRSETSAADHRHPGGAANEASGRGYLIVGPLSLSVAGSF